MILITGCARSGTSITSHIIRACGGNFGEVLGTCENKYIRDELTKKYLSEQGYDPLCQDNLITPDKAKPWPELREKVLEVLKDEPRAYKGCKMIHFWPVWAEAFPEAKWVIVRRSKDQIVDSCIRTSFMHKRKTRQGWEQWVDQHLERMEEMRKVVDFYEVWPEKGMKNIKEFNGLIDWLGLKWNSKAENLISPQKFHV